MGSPPFRSPDGKLILYGNSNLTLNIYHMDTRTSDSAFGIKTLPEKCVWGELSDVFTAACQNLLIQEVTQILGIKEKSLSTTICGK